MSCGACEHCGYHVGHHPDCLLFDEAPLPVGSGPFGTDEDDRHPAP